MSNFLTDRDRWQRTYNYLRPHEALDDQPPITRYVESKIRRPPAIPEIMYEPGAMLRKVSQVGDIHYHRVRIGVGHGLSRETVKLVERARELEIYFGPKLVRVMALESCTARRPNERV